MVEIERRNMDYAIKHGVPYKPEQVVIVYTKKEFLEAAVRAAKEERLERMAQGIPG